MKEIDKCVSFVENNGWVFSYNDYELDGDENCSYYHSKDLVSIGFDYKNNSITIFDDSGDVKTFDPDIYTLIGFLIHRRQIDSGYRNWLGDKNDSENR